MKRHEVAWGKHSLLKVKLLVPW